MPSRLRHHTGLGSILVLAAGLLISGVAQPSGATACPGKKQPPTHRDAAAKRAPSGPGLSSLPPDAQSAISASLGRENAAYHVVADGRGFHAVNPDHGLSADFTCEGVRLSSGTAQWGLRLQGVGYGTASRALKAVEPHADANRVEYRRGAVTEWYVNGPAGLEQGFTLQSRPAKREGKPLTLALVLSGDLTASLDSTGKALTLAQAGHAAALRYGSLIASDASGRDLRSWMELKDGDLLLKVDDDAARYPIAVDPIVQQVKLSGPLNYRNSFGVSVAIDGDTVVVGQNHDAFVFVKPSGGWSTTSTYTAELLPLDIGNNDFFGYPVAINGDTIVVGALYGTPGNDLTWEGSGAMYVFTKPAGGWLSTSECAKLFPNDANFINWNSNSASIEGDTVVVGAPFADNELGAAYLFTRPAAGWPGTSAPPYPLVTETAKLAASDGVPGDWLGQGVGISGDTIVAGAVYGNGDPAGYGYDSNPGAAYVFVSPSTGWASVTETAKLIASDGAAGDSFGAFANLSGNTVVVGAPQADIGSHLDQGAAYVFVEPAGGWATAAAPMTETAKLSAYDGGAGDFFGNVSISGDRIVVGAVKAGSHQGSAYVFVRPPGGWQNPMTRSVKLTAADGVVGDFFGVVGTQGDTILVGAYGNLNGGAAYVFEGCDDGNPCTDDSVNPLTRECVYTPNANACDDGNACTTGDTCSSGTCAGGPSLNCDDGNVCTTDTCDPSSGCAHTNNTMTCDDGNPNTVGDTCSGGVCAGVAVDRCAGVICTASDQCHATGACDPGTGLCSNPPKADGTSCSDGNACTQADTCQSGTCTGGNPVICTNGDQCNNSGTCQPSTGQCSAPVPKVNGTACNDGNACTQTDTCQSGRCAGTNYSWSGVLEPINADGSSVFKLGSTIPTKFKLTGACAGNPSLVANIYLYKAGSATDDVNEAGSTAAADTGTTFRYSATDDQYIFNLGTKGMLPALYNLYIDLGDGAGMRGPVQLGLKR